MKIVLSFLLGALLYTSCQQQAANDQRAESPELVSVSVQGQMIDPQYVKKPIPIPVNDPFVVRAGAPNIKPVYTNVSEIITPRKVKAKNPIVFSPGENGLGLPQVKQWKDSLLTAGIPELIIAKDPFHPVNNPHSFSFFTRRQGMLHDDISCMIQDHKGNIWMGTYGGGLIRYDGLNFYHYAIQEGLAQNHILSLLADKEGNIWLGTRSGGAIMFDGVFFRFFNTHNGLADDRVETIRQDSQGRIWFGTYNGASCFDGQNITNYSEDSGLMGAVVYFIEEDNLGHLWFGTRGQGISRFDGTHFFQYKQQQGLIHDYMVAATGFLDGSIWLATDGGGICRFDGEYFYYFNEENGLPDNFITTILRDRNGHIWIGTRSSGLVKFSNNLFIVFNEDQGLINEFITAIMEDRNGKIWFGSYGGGIAQYNGDLFSHYNEKQGLKDSFIRSIFQDDKGNMWFGSNRQGVFMYDGSAFYEYSTEQGLPYYRIAGIAQDSKGVYWFATTGGGIAAFDGRYFTHYAAQQGLVDDFILSMIIDSHDNIWLTTRSDGLVKFDGTSFTNYRKEHGLIANDTRVIREDSRGGFWIGTGSAGLCYFDGESFTHYDEAAGGAFNNILDLTTDRNGNLWVATNGAGVVLFDGTHYTNYTEKEGLLSNVVYSVLEDSKGDMWVGTRMGLNRLLVQNRTDLDNAKRQGILFKGYTTDDGFIGIGCNSRALLEDSKGRIWVGANDVLTMYSPHGDSPDSIPPDIQITRIDLFNEPQQWDQLNTDTVLRLANGLKIKNFRFNGITPWYGLPKDLSLFHSNNFVTFRFSGVTSYFVKKVRYQFRLDGLEDNWSIPSFRTEVAYGNLRPGKYIFRVRAINSEGYSSDEFQYTFRIRPPWWATWWAYGLYVIVIVVAVVSIVRWQKRINREKELKKQRELMLVQEVEIARKSAEFKQNFLASMSHEIRTPLTGILGMASMLNRLPLENDAREYVDALNQAGENLRETINMILDISKIEAGKLQLKESIFSIREVLYHSEKLFAPLCNDNVAIVCQLDRSLPEYLVSDQLRVSQIIKNLLSNAVKFTREGKITLKAEVEEHHKANDENENPMLLVRISVCDTGIGISLKDQQKLFTPFYQTGKTAGQQTDGTGLGLAICKELATLLGGSIGVESEQGKGSCFWFTFKTFAENRAGKDLVVKKSETRQKSLNVLLVEDKAITQKVITLMLNAMGHTVTAASNGFEALEKYAPDTFDIILMDIQMPEMDGITATRTLKSKHEKVPPIVGLSANAFEGDREKYMNQGMDEYLTKPVKDSDFRNLLAKLGLTS